MPSSSPPPLTVPLVDRSGVIAPSWSRYFVDFSRVVTVSTAPSDAQYLVATANGDLTAERNLGLLSSGYLKVTVALGIATPTSTATIPAADLTGTIPDARFPATLPALSGVNLTALNASQLTSGTVPIARLPIPLLSGTYTPTLTNVANLDASTTHTCQYLRVDSVVTVSGYVTVNPTAPGAVQLGLSLPIASAFATVGQCAGTAASPGIAGQSAAVVGDVANTRAEVQFIAVDLTNQVMYFQFSYLVV